MYEIPEELLMTDHEFQIKVADVAEYMIRKNIRAVHIPRVGAPVLILELREE